MKIVPILLISILFILSGCASSQPTPVATTDNNFDATAQLAEAAASVSQSLGELAVVTKATSSAPKRLPITDNYPGLSNLVSIDWSGPVGPLAKRLADASGYRLRILGVQPAIPPIITITAKNTPVADLLRDIAFQSGGKVNFYVLPSVNILELRYTNT